MAAFAQASRQHRQLLSAGYHIRPECLVEQKDFHESAGSTVFRRLWLGFGLSVNERFHGVIDSWSTKTHPSCLTAQLPRYKTSILVFRKQSIASRGVQTMGSFSLNDVFSTRGTPVSL